MSSLELLKETFHLSPGDAEFVANCLRPGEVVLTDVGPKVFDWLKAKAKETGDEFLAVTVAGNTLYIFLRIDTDIIEALPFHFKGNHPLEELWRASVSSNFEDRYHTVYISFTQHRPN